MRSLTPCRLIRAILAILLLVIAGDVVSDAIDEDGNDWIPERQLQHALVEAAASTMEAVVSPPEQRQDERGSVTARVTSRPTVILWRSAFDPEVDPPPVNLM
ncbi:MAG: hypothetical protein H0W83_00750 [Planctomycetes bacterium]|nr:hypothetical protein [Planctomycetota bacterium]